MKKQIKQRRGILLLVVLSLLSLFVLIGVTFIVVAGQYRRGTISTTKIERTGESPASLIDKSVMEILNPIPGSPIDGHGLLEDLYGRELFRGTIDLNLSRIVNGQFFIFQTEYIAPSVPYEPPESWKFSGFFNGCVLTLTSGQFKGKSVRVVSYDYEQRPMPNDDEFVATIIVEGAGLPALEDSFVINGRPFNGTGHGYDLAADDLGLEYTTLNEIKQISEALRVNGGSLGLDGGADESYDAPDFQNLFLGWQSDNPTDGSMIIPSFHRPSVVNYVLNSTYTDVDEFTNDEAYKLVMLRPTAFDNPSFSGSNPLLDSSDDTQFPEFSNASSAGTTSRTEYMNRLITGLTSATGQTTWDVDNDGDGVPDSVWIDLGTPASMTSDGRQYKALYAIRCIDLDGKINISTAGILDDAGGGADATGSAAGSGTNFSTPGAGFGPADVVIADVLIPAQDPQSFLELRYADARGSENRPGRHEDLNGNGTLDFGEDTNGNGVLDGADFFDDPEFQQQDINFDLLGSYIDPLGRASLVIDHLGQPYLHGHVDATGESTVKFSTLSENTPYEANLNFDDGRDSRFRETDLERVLRRFDYGANQLSDRLVWDATTNPVTFRVVPEAITTRSFDIPMTNSVADASRRAIGESLSAVDLLASTLSPNVAAELLPFELRHGQKMNLNRPFGDGIDADASGVANGITDEADELFNIANAVGTRPDGMEYLNDDVIFDGATAQHQIQAPVRQLYARNIYSLLMLLRNVAVDIPDRDGAAAPDRTARILAQWAVNVVDFLDTDSIMTPFEYDAVITDGWDADGDLTLINPGCGVVWGCERPELLITETLATHDVRTEDRDDETLDLDGAAATTSDPTPDADLDQRYRPQGSLFVELFNPWSSDFLKSPPELYDPALTGVHLNKVVTSNNSAGAPRTSSVWRMLITNRVPAGLGAVRNSTTSPLASSSIFNPDHPGWDPTNIAFPTPADTRFVYFVNDVTYNAGDFLPKAVGALESDFFTGIHAAAVPVLVPKGGYAVAGSAGTTRVNLAGNTVYTTLMGFQTAFNVDTSTTVDYDETRRVEVNLSATRQVSVLDNGSTSLAAGAPPEAINPAPPQPAAGEIAPCTAFLVNHSSTGPTNGLSVSEPLGGYPSTGLAALSPDIPELVYTSGVYDVPFDAPLIAALTTNGGSGDPQVGNDGFGGVGQLVQIAAGEDEGMVPNFRVVHLQRLANPLIAWNPLPGDLNHDAARPVNPYRTIDSAPIDLAIFNGFGRSPGSATSVAFHSRQRGDSSQLLPAGLQTPDRALWKSERIDSIAGGLMAFEPVSETVAPTNVSVNPPTMSHHFEFVLRTSLGHLNHAYQPIDLGLVGTYPGAPQYVPPGVDPERPTFPWLNWQNRPFSNVMELLQVPVSSSFHLGHDYSISDVSLLPYGTFEVGSTRPFGHLLNFFAEAPGLYALFEHVEVPSPYLGTRTWYNETDMDAAYTAGEAPIGLQPPFHSLSKFRNPGLVNINTATASSWLALESAMDEPPTYTDLETSRRASAGITGNTTLDATIPSQFANPFRSPNASDLVPLATMGKAGFEVGLLRPEGATGGTQPLFTINSDLPHFDARPNPAIRFADLQRVSSMVTNHSNVFAVWVTLGFFEYEDTDGDGIPELGREIGEDTGDIQRNRGFYLIDRSIPAAYEPGVEHNESDTIILRTMIE